MTKLLFLHRDKSWFDAFKPVHAFLDKHIDKVFEDLEAEIASGENARHANGEERSDPLYTMAPHGPSDREALRSQVLNVFLSSNEMTSILISNVFYALDRHPHVYKKLREESLSYGDGPLTWDQLRSMAYL
jgi:cytochrome P450